MLKCNESLHCCKTLLFFCSGINETTTQDEIDGCTPMNKRDDFFYQAVIYAKEKNYSAARSMLRNLLFEYPDDIEGLLLYSIVAPNKEITIQALKRVLLLDPDHEIAFNKLVKLKQATPASIPSPTAPLPTPNSSATRTRTMPAPVAPPPPKPTPQPQKTAQHRAPEEMIKRTRLEPSQRIEERSATSARKRRRSKIATQAILLSLFLIAFLCTLAAALQKFFGTFASGV